VRTVPISVDLKIRLLAVLFSDAIDGDGFADLALRTDRNVRDEEDERENNAHHDARPAAFVRLCAAAAVGHRGCGGARGVLVAWGLGGEPLPGARYLHAESALRTISIMNISRYPDIIWIYHMYILCG